MFSSFSSGFLSRDRRLSKGSIGGRRLLSILPGMILGILIGLTITARHNRPIAAPGDSDLTGRLSDVDHLSSAEVEILAQKALSRLGEIRRLAANTGLDANTSSDGQITNSRRQVHLGINNVRRLLPLAKRLTVESLREGNRGADDLKTSVLLREKRLINAVRKVVLDQHLGGMAVVRDDRLSEIRIGSDYAPYLTSDDEAIFLLGHELMHVAARSGRLDRFIENVAENAKLSANVEATEDQKEDLACDLTGAQVLKRFIALKPTREAEAERLSRGLEYEPPSVRLARAWEDFCASYYGFSGDEYHLSHEQTIRALVGLDPTLKGLVPDDLAASPLSH